MNFPLNQNIVSAYKRFSKYMSWAVIVISMLVMMGWVFNLTIFKSIIHQWPTMKPITAICFILTGFSVLLYRPGLKVLSNKSNIVGYVFAWVVFIISAMLLSQYFFSINFTAFDSLTTLFRENDLPHGRMALFSAVCFFFIGASLISIRHTVQYLFPQIITILSVVVSVIGILDYLFWANDLYDVFGYEKMALHTSVSFLLLGLAIFFLRPEAGFMAIVASDTLGGLLIRKLFLRIVLMLLVLMELKYIAQQFGYIDAEFGQVLSTIISIVLISFILWRTARDLSLEDIERKKTEEELRHANQKLTARSAQLEASNKELEQFAYIASHDLQEPLKTISNYSNLIYSRYKGELDSNADTYLEFLNDATKRMKNLIKDILDYARTGRIKTIGECDCNKIIQDVLRDLDTAIKEANAKIDVKPLPVIHCYPDIRQVFLNLINNAIKYRKHGTDPQISISGESSGNMWLFKVADNGIGIEKQYYERIFILFQKLHSRRKYEGSGIGLALSKKVIEYHGGKIWVESEIGKGSTFYFTISKTIKDDQ